MPMENAKLPGGPMSGLVASAVEYMMDASQRSVLFLDVLRQRGDQYREHIAETAPHVLQYAAELIIDGRKLDEPVNYALVRIIPPKGVEIDLNRRPFIVVDPRAGHGPGIGGFKADSEIGVAMKAGHPCYFIGFLPEPMPGQTIERVARAEAVFIEKVISRHPEADGKPCVIGNCQAGWAVMILASLRPELFGPIIVAGAPLAYWAGVHGKYPMRYSGGLLGGSWLTALTSDLGGGKFDGAWLVQNFESSNPSNTLWTKQYNVYSKVDSEADRYLEFERWWGGHVNLNAEEIQFIVDELFDRLTIGHHDPAGGEIIADEKLIDDELYLLGIQIDVPAPPAYEFEVPVGLGTTFAYVVLLGPQRIEDFGLSKFCTSQAPSNFAAPRSLVSAVASFLPASHRNSASDIGHARRPSRRAARLRR